MTKEEIKEYIRPRLQKRYRCKYREDQVWAWDLVKNAVRDATASQKAEMTRAVESTSVIQKALSDEAEQEAETMLQDDSLDLAELARILGD